MAELKRIKKNYNVTKNYGTSLKKQFINISLNERFTKKKTLKKLDKTTLHISTAPKSTMYLKKNCNVIYNLFIFLINLLMQIIFYRGGRI